MFGSCLLDTAFNMWSRLVDKTNQDKKARQKMKIQLSANTNLRQSPHVTYKLALMELIPKLSTWTFQNHRYNCFTNNRSRDWTDKLAAILENIVIKFLSQCAAFLSPSSGSSFTLVSSILFTSNYWSVKVMWSVNGRLQWQEPAICRVSHHATSITSWNSLLTTSSIEAHF